MADAKIYKEVVQDLSYELDKASKAMGDISRLQKGMIKGFTEITKTSTATGQAWISVSRFFSGSGFWKIQNKVKAISNMLQFMQIQEKKRNEAEEERMKQLADNEENLKSVISLHKKIEKIVAGTASLEESQSLTKNKMFKLYKAEHGHKMALFMIQQKLEKSIKKATEYESEGSKVQGKNYRKRLKEILSIEKRLSNVNIVKSMEVKLEERLEELNATRGTITQAHLDHWDKFNKEGQAFMLLQTDLNEEYKTRFAIYTEEKKKRSTMDAEQKKALEEERLELVDMHGQIIDMNDEWSKRSALTGAGTVDIGGEQKKGFIEGDDEKMATFKEGLGEWMGPMSDQLRENFKVFDKFLTIQETAKEAYNKIKGGWEWVNKPKNRKVMAKAAGQALQFFGKIILYFALFLLAIIVLQKTGVLSYIIEFGRQVLVWGAVLIEVIYGIFVDVIEWVSLMAEFIMVLASGAPLAEVLPLLMPIFSKTWDILWGLIKMVGLLLWNLWGTLLVAFGTWWYKAFADGKSWTQRIASFVLGVLGGYLMYIAATNLLSSLNPVVAAMGTGAMVLAGIGLGGAIGGMAKGGSFAFASGGITPSSGSYLVGERGPEMVNLPAGSRIHNNSNTRNMSGSNTINVSVNGRVGASDAELRDIANKIGRMVNMEVNRNTNMGVRGA